MLIIRRVSFLTKYGYETTKIYYLQPSYPLVQRCPTHSPLLTCGEWLFKCGECDFFLNVLLVLTKLPITQAISKLSTLMIINRGSLLTIYLFNFLY